jgi:hypothetical protein
VLKEYANYCGKFQKEYNFICNVFIGILKLKCTTVHLFYILKKLRLESQLR